MFSGVEYRRWEACRADAVLGPPDVLVAIRDWRVIAANRFAPLQLFWTGDAFDQPFVKGLEVPANRPAIDFAVLQSDWQESTFRGHLGIAPWRCLRTRLGFAPDVGVRRVADLPPRARRLIYTSTPFRGLDLLLSWFPVIRQVCPDAELRVCSSMRVYGVGEQEDRAQFGRLYDLGRQPGVTLLGSLSQPQLADELRQARVLAYPNHWPETFCIAAIEAQASGCPVVTSTLGALPETVGDGGVCVPGDPRSDPAFRDRFIAEVVSMLTDDTRWEGFSRGAMQRSREQYDWRVIAGEWERWCATALSGEDPMVERIARHAGAGRFALLDRLMSREPKPPAVDDAAWQALVRVLAYRNGSAPAPGEAHWARLVRQLGPIRRIPGFDSWRAPNPVTPTV
jgi:glycosyltransferase involved in cell wall biosynthesis